MAKQSIDIGVNTGNAAQQVDSVADSLNALGQSAGTAQDDLADLAKTLNAFLTAKAQAAGKTPRLLDLSQDMQQLQELKKQFQEVLAMSRQPGGIGATVAIANGANRPRVPSQVNMGGVAASPQAQAAFMDRMLTRLLTHHLGSSAAPINTGLTAQDLTGRSAPAGAGASPVASGAAARAPTPQQPDSPGGFGQAARHLADRALAGGAGGTLGGAAGSAMQGAASGLGGMGVVGGGLLGLAGFGAFKAASTMNEGLDKAKAEAIEIDRFKRQLGDLGVNFDALRDSVRASAEGMGLSFDQVGKMAQILARDSHSKIRDPSAIGAETQNAAAVARATGIDGESIARFFGEMRGAGTTDSVQDSRRLALSIADAIKRSGDPLNADKLLQAMTSFASRTRDATLGPVNAGAYGGMLSGLMGKGIGADAASGMIGQFDASTRSGGSSEASEAFIFNALGGSRLGAGDAMRLRQGGMFASEQSTFGNKKSPFYSPGREGASDEMNVAKYMRHLDMSFPGKDQQSQDVKESSLASFFGGNFAHARQFKKTYDQYGSGGLDTTSGMLRRYGMDPSSVNMAGFTQLSGIANARGLGGLQEQRALLEGRKDLKDGQPELLKKLVTETDPETLRKGLAQIAATLDAEKTDGQKLNDVAKTMDQNIQSLATGLIPASLLTNQLLGALVEKLAPDSSVAQKMRGEQDAQAQADSALPGATPAARQTARGATDKYGQRYLPDILKTEKELGMAPGELAALADKEGGFNPFHKKGGGVGKDGKPYTTGAQGMFQMLPAAIKDATPEFVQRYGKAPSMDDPLDQMRLGGIYKLMMNKQAGGDPDRGYRLYHGGAGYDENKSPISRQQLNASQAKYAGLRDVYSPMGQAYRKDNEDLTKPALARTRDMTYKPVKPVETPAGNPEKAAAAQAQAGMAFNPVNISGNFTLRDPRGLEVAEPVPFFTQMGKPSPSGGASWANSRGRP